MKVKKSFPYVDHNLLPNKTYTIDKMIVDAGVVVLKEITNKKTFPDDAFIKCEGYENEE